MRMAPGQSPARVGRRSVLADGTAAGPLPAEPPPSVPAPDLASVLQLRGLRPSRCEGVAAATAPPPPAIGEASFDEHPFDAAWTAAVRRSVRRFVAVAGRPLLGPGAARDALVESAAAALRSRMPLCPHAEARQHAVAAFARTERRVAARLCADYFRFCAVALRVAG